MIEEHANYIDGAWRPALAEHVFEITSAGDRGRPIARFPRSSPRDIGEALSSCESAEAGWQSTALEARRGVILRALALLAKDPDPGDLVARSLGLAAEEIAAVHMGFAHDLERDLLRARHAGYLASGGASGGIVAVQLHWSELWAGPVREVLALLLAGRTVLLLSDPHVPFIAERIARALEASALPRGVLALVHDDCDASLDAVLGDVRVDTLRASGARARVRHLERQAHRQQAREASAERRAHESTERRVERAPTLPSARTRTRFGAGVDDRRGPELELSLLRNKSYVVTRAADPAAAAAEIVERAFGRAQSLSGQRPGAIGRVLCHERQFSRFSAELLVQLERHADIASPLAAREPATLDHLRRACELGLDEGATLVFSRREINHRNGNGSARVPPLEASEEETVAAHGPSSSPSRDRRAEAILWPAVFTNVEEHMRLAWLGRPAPVLCLMRVASDERGASLAQEIDRDPLAEDLSASTAAIEDPA